MGVIKNKPAYYRRKADEAMQIAGRLKYKRCEICGGEMSCMHHYFPKSTASALRYDEDNLIPICVGCHFRHHNGDPRIHAEVLQIRGMEWHKKLAKKKETIQKASLGYYKEIINKYKQNESS